MRHAATVKSGPVPSLPSRALTTVTVLQYSSLERGRVSAPVAARRDVRAGFGELGVRSERGRSVGVRATRARTKIAPGPGRERNARRGRYFPERHGAARRRIAPLILRVAEARRRSTMEDWERERERERRTRCFASTCSASREDEPVPGIMPR